MREGKNDVICSIFLDIDGVMNSTTTRTTWDSMSCWARGGAFPPLCRVWECVIYQIRKHSKIEYLRVRSYYTYNGV